VLALVGGVFVGAVAWSDDRPAGAAAAATSASAVSRQPPSTGAQGSNPTTAAPVASMACKTAVDRANTMLATAVKLHRELVEYSKIMTDPSSRGLSGRELVDKSAPGLRAGTSESAKFTQALADYRQVVDQCRLQPVEPGGRVRAPWWRRRSHWTGSGRWWGRTPRRRSPAAGWGSGWGSRRRRSGTGPWILLSALDYEPHR
jgi:hypothetical protein